MEKSDKSVNNPETIVQRIRETPNEANRVQYPLKFHNKIVKINASKFDRSPIPTVIIAIENGGYSESLFRSDVRSTLSYFHLDYNQVREILLKPAGPNFEVVNSGEATMQMEKIVKLLNRGTQNTSVNSDSSTMRLGSLTHLRIVSLGISYSKYYFDALEYLLNHWEGPYELKYVQYITKLDSNNCEKLRFWKTACTNNLIGEVQFVNLNDYLPFGHYKNEQGCKLLSDLEKPESRDSNGDH